MTTYRTHRLDALRVGDIEKQVVLSGWIHNRRDHGGVFFIDLRDNYGITQLVVHEDAPFYEEICHVQKETVIRVEGTVKKREEALVNPELLTGEVEVWISAYEVLGPAEMLPFSVFPEDPTAEDLRLKYRFLDLRRKELHETILLRSTIIKSVRDRMHAMGFTEFQTPILTSSSPEGARDFLVPSRLHPGKFYALPQAPQQFKQLLMVSGFDRYFQIAPCFRDEDARANRSPGEFYQIDIEMAFATQEEIFAMVESLLSGVFTDFSDPLCRVDEAPFIHIPYLEAMDKYGSDKPDLRIPIELKNVSEIFLESKFDIFKKQVKKGAVVKAIPVRGTAARGKPFCESLLEFATSKPVGAKGLAYIIWKDGEASGKPITNHLNAEEIEKVRVVCGLGDGDVVFFVCDKKEKAEKIAGLVRSEIGARLSLDIQTFSLSAMESQEGEDEDASTGEESFIDRAVKEDPSLSTLKKREAAFKAMVLTQVGDKGPAFRDELLEIAKAEGAPLAFYIAGENGKTVQSHFADVLPDKDRRIIDDRIKLKDGDIALFVFGRGKDVSHTARLIRRTLSEKLSLPQVDDFRFCWIVDFPMFEKDEKTGKIQFSHNPFSMPQGGMAALLEKDPLDVLAFQYDIVCNGEELSSGAIRNHRLDVMYKAFEIAGYTQTEVDEKFQNMVKAFKYGAPPHGGIAPGLDRIVMLLAGKSSIRDTIAFPMNQAAQDLMMDAPRAVSDAQLQELAIRVDIDED